MAPLIGLLAFLLLVGTAEAQQPAADQPSAQLIERGQSQFVQSCSLCHGADAKGAEGPNLLHSTLVRHDNGGDLIAPIIRNGRPKKGMPPVPMSEDQLAAVVAFIHARVKANDRSSPTRPGSDFDLKKLSTGDAAAGRRYFEGAGKCGGCHSPTGDLAHIATKYNPADLQGRFLYPESDAPPSVTISLLSGDRIQGTLVDHDNFYVGIRDAAGWYRSWPRSEVKLEIHDPLAPHIRLLEQYTDENVHDLFAYLETLK